MPPAKPRFDYNTPEMAHMIEASVLRIRDHEYLDSRLTDYVRCEPHERTRFEQVVFREVWEHREPLWDWKNKQPSPKENADYHLVHEVRTPTSPARNGN